MQQNELKRQQQQQQQQQQQLLLQQSTTPPPPLPPQLTPPQTRWEIRTTRRLDGGDGGSKEDEFWRGGGAGTGPSVKDLLTTQADPQVKPIFNRAIEAIDPPPFRDELPPACRKPPTTGTEEGGAYSADDVSKLTPADLGVPHGHLQVAGHARRARR